MLGGQTSVPALNRNFLFIILKKCFNIKMNFLSCKVLLSSLSNQVRVVYLEQYNIE